ASSCPLDSNTTSAAGTVIGRGSSPEVSSARDADDTVAVICVGAPSTSAWPVSRTPGSMGGPPGNETEPSSTAGSVPGSTLSRALSRWNPVESWVTETARGGGGAPWLYFTVKSVPGATAVGVTASTRAHRTAGEPPTGAGHELIWLTSIGQSRP